MGRRGFRPAPTALKVLRGNPGKEKLPENEARPTLGIPPPPSWILDDPEVLAKYHELSERLYRIGLMTENDGEQLATYCDLFIEYGRCVTELRGKETIFRMIPNDADGTIQIDLDRLAVRKLNLVDKLLRLATHFGMTPSARVGLHVIDKKPEDDLLAYVHDDRGRPGKGKASG